MKIIAFDGSPRKNGNSTILLKTFLDRAENRGADIKLYKTKDLDIQACRGCLMCNVIKRCAIRNDDWQRLASEILEADVLAFSTPVYFHHTTSSMKQLIDRFRSFIKVQITEDGLIHIPHQSWNKQFMLFTAHGSSLTEDAQPLVQLFQFMTETLGPGNTLKSLTAVRLALSGQIAFSADQLTEAYKKLGLPLHLVNADHKRNTEWLSKAELFADELLY